jgi:hypothetical protein
MAKLSAAQLTCAKHIVHDAFALAGIRVKSIVNSQTQKDLPIGLDSVPSSAKKLADELIDRKYANINPSLQDIFDYGSIALETKNTRHYMYYNGSYCYNTIDKRISKIFPDVAQMALGIATVALKLGLLWDDTNHTTYELEIFEKSYLGQAVKDVGAYISVQSAALSTQKPAKTTTTKTTQSTPRQAGAAPQNGYKSSGPQSGSARDLISTPGNKEILTGLVYKIEGVNAKSAKNKAKLYIKPLEPSGSKGKNGKITNRVMMGSANGYTDCVCHFDNAQDADDFLKAWANANATQTQFTNVQVVRKNADPNGYFKIDTEYGPCYISAVKLNEQVNTGAEELEEAVYIRENHGYIPVYPDSYEKDLMKF